MSKLNVVSYGEALWDLLPSGAVLGGAVLNFAYRIGSLGHEASLISCLGKDTWGDRALDRISGLGMDTKHIQRREDAPTGTVDVLIDASGDPTFTINSPAAYDHIQLTPELSDRVSAAGCFCFGTLIQRSPVSRQTLTSLLACYGDGVVLCDINLRKNCYTEETIRDSLARAHILKINENELDEIAVLLGITGTDLPARVDALLERQSLDCCLVTLGIRGAYAATREGERVYGPAYRVIKEDAAGSGDAFTAGFVHGLLGLKDLSHACRMGNAMGSLVAGQVGATQFIHPDDVARMIAGEEYEQVDTGLSVYMS